MSALLDLAARCEAATENDGELFEEAFRLCFPKPSRIWITDNTGDWTPEYSAYHGLSWHYSELLEAGGFLDAAMSLVLEGHEFGVGNSGNPDGGGIWAWCEKETKGIDFPYARAATLALALCAAALRARAAQEAGQ